MHEAVRRFTEKMGILCEHEGMPRSAGRMFGFLLATGETLSLDDITERLEVSKGSASTNARLLVEVGLLERVGLPGDRRDFYRVEADPWETMLRRSQDRWRGMVQVLADAAEHLPTAEGRDRARVAETFHHVVIEGSEALLENWRGLRRRGAGPDRERQSAA